MYEDFYSQGLEKAKQKDFTGAIEVFNQALQQNPYWDELYCQRGLAYFDTGAIHQAVSDYTKAIELNSQYPEAYYGRALARLTLKNLPGSLSDVEKAISLKPNSAAAYNLRAVINRKQGRIHDAITNFKQAAQLYLKQKEKENCRHCLERLQQLQPKPQRPINQLEKRPKTHIISEKYYFHQLLDKAESADTRQAMEDLNWILKADPQDAKAYCCRGVVYCKLGKYQEAITDFNQSLRLDFQDAIVYRNRGKARSMFGDRQGAIADFNQALQIEPEDPMTYIARGNAYRVMGDYLKAIDDYNQALQRNTDNPHTYYNRGMTYTCIEEMQLACDDYQKAASIFCEQEDWDNYQLVIDSLENITTSTAQKTKATAELLRQRLLRMVGGYWEIAERLIEQAKYDYPGMPEPWYIEKVVHDLERNRGL